jgi:DNA-directed RNA polymerase subunit RPC12/RpoP
MLVLREVVIKFLEEHPGYVCAECTALSLGVPLHLTTMITLGLHRADGFETADGVCSRCHRLIRLIKAERRP